MSKLSSLKILILLLLFSVACKQNSSTGQTGEPPGKTTEISGVLHSGGGETLVLEEMGAREYIPVDTVQCDEGGNFHISYLQEQQAFYVLRYGSSGYITLLMEPGESIEFSGHLENKNSYTISGSPGSVLLQTLAAEHKKALEALGEIARKNREQVLSPEYTVLKQKLDQQFDSITSAFQELFLKVYSRECLLAGYPDSTL